MSGISRQLTLKKGAPGDQVVDLLCAASQLPGKVPTNVDSNPRPPAPKADALPTELLRRSRNKNKILFLIIHAVSRGLTYTVFS